ncbi:MAG: sulfotransferase, partial [Fidelibacterota bacterium]
MPLNNIEQYRFIFIAGLHRSGTTILGDLLKQHPAITGLENTGVSMNEGQLVQSVYPAAFRYGGPGKFGFAPEMHLTEKSALFSNENRLKLFREWGQYLDLQQLIIVEKSPPNLIKTRFLQALFPSSLFVIIKRHPIAVTFATKNRWKNSSVIDLFAHWVKCHEIFQADKPYLTQVVEFKYSEFVQDPDTHL